MNNKLLSKLIALFLNIWNFIFRNKNMSTDKGKRELIRGSKIISKKMIIKIKFKPFEIEFDKKTKYADYDNIDVSTENMNIKLTTKKEQ